MRLSVIAGLLAAFFLLPVEGNAQHNPYLDRKKKNRPSVRQKRDDAKHLKRQKRMAKKQMRRSRRDISRANKRRTKGRG
jgi:hypothetical protein